MHRKRIIGIVVMTICFGGTAYMLYLSFFNKPTAVHTVGVTSEPIVEAVKTREILPHGTKLDFSGVKKFNGAARLFPYPKPVSSEIGQSLNTLIN